MKKFRVWIIKNIDDDESTALKAGYLKQQLSKYHWFYLHPDGQEIAWGSEDNPFEPLIIDRDCLVEFSTGLLDRNGVEMFEGDVMQHPLSKEKYTVKWINFYCGYRACYNASYGKDDTSLLALQLGSKGGSAIVSNIHEVKNDN